jgi:hypothetical protein
MSLLGSAVLRPVAMSVLAYDDLALVLITLIGSAGVEALTTRASHLALGHYPEWAESDKRESDQPFGRVSSWLQVQDSARATEAATAMLSTLGALLVTFIGEPLTMRLLRKAWPEAFAEAGFEERPA